MCAWRRGRAADRSDSAGHSALDAERTHLLVECCPVDVELLGGLLPIPVVGIQGSEDDLAFRLAQGFDERSGGPRLIFDQPQSRTPLHDVHGEILDTDCRGTREHGRPLDDVLKLADKKANSGMCLGCKVYEVFLAATRQNIEWVIDQTGGALKILVTVRPLLIMLLVSFAFQFVVTS